MSRAQRRVASCLVAPYHDKKFCIMTHPQWLGRAHALPLASRTCWPCCGSLLAMSIVVSHALLLCCSPLLLALVCMCPAVSRYSLLYRYPAPKMSSSPSSYLLHMFFTHFFSFILLPTRSEFFFVFFFHIFNRTK